MDGIPSLKGRGHGQVTWKI